MNNFEREYPLFSACGLNCGLCPRFHTKGASRCPGCAGAGFFSKHPSCGVLSCCKRRGIEFCHQCSEYPCHKYDGADVFDSFITHKHQFRDMEKVREMGWEKYQPLLNEKVELLNQLLLNYDDGRRKTFYCTAVNLLELPDIRNVMARLAENGNSACSIKEKACAAVEMFEEIADRRKIGLKLRKKQG